MAFAIARRTGTRTERRGTLWVDASGGRWSELDYELAKQSSHESDRVLASGTRSLIERTLRARRIKVSNQGTETVSFGFLYRFHSHFAILQT